MGVSIPKPKYCEWWDPENKPDSNFNYDPDDGTCTIQQADERRSRATAGNILFRSIGFGLHQNNITVTSTWEYEDLPTNPGTWLPTSNLVNHSRVRFDISNGVTTETFYVNQNITWTPPSDPVVVLDAIPNLRDIINTGIDTGQGYGFQGPSQFIRLPSIDYCASVPSVECWNYTTDKPDYMGRFSTIILTGGEGAPIDLGTINTLRTGPALTMYFIGSSENDNGEVIIANTTRLWNGACWQPYDPLNPGVDPDNLPPGFSCAGGPESEC